MTAEAHYWRRYIGYALAGVPVAWGLEFDIPVLLQLVPDFLAGPRTFIPTGILLLYACGSRFGDAGSTAIGLRVKNLYETAPGLGRSPDYVVLCRLASAQSVLLSATTIGLTMWGHGDVRPARLFLFLVLYVSTCATVQNLVLAMGISRLSTPGPYIPTEHFESRNRLLDSLARFEQERYVELHNSSVTIYNFMAKLVLVAAIIPAVLGSAALMLAATQYRSAQISLLVGPLVIAIGGFRAHRATRREHEDRMRRRREAAEKVLTTIATFDPQPNPRTLQHLRYCLDELDHVETARLHATVASMLSTRPTAYHTWTETDAARWIRVLKQH